MKTHSSPFLRWAGSKRRLIPSLIPLLQSASRLVEPFVGSGSVFLAADYPRLLLADTNPVLISLYKHLQRDPSCIVEQARALFIEANRTPTGYVKLRERFNSLHDLSIERSALFLYLNKFGFNGLYRTNKKGECNTPYGHPKNLPSYPEAALWEFAQRIRSAEIVCDDFESVMNRATPGDVVYCDPPYAKQEDKESFTAYGEKGFGWGDQERLARKARELSRLGITVVVSNHDTCATRLLYAGATIHSLSVRRSISATASGRGIVNELVAVFSPSIADDKGILDLMPYSRLPPKTPPPLPDSHHAGDPCSLHPKRLEHSIHGV